MTVDGNSAKSHSSNSRVAHPAPFASKQFEGELAQCRLLRGAGRRYLFRRAAVALPKASGYFYAYANGAWNCYANNKGHVRLKVALKK